MIKPAGGDVHSDTHRIIRIVRSMMGETRDGFPSTLPASGSPPGAFFHAVNQIEKNQS